WIEWLKKGSQFCGPEDLEDFTRSQRVWPQDDVSQRMERLVRDLHDVPLVPDWLQYWLEKPEWLRAWLKRNFLNVARSLSELEPLTKSLEGTSQEMLTRVVGYLR